MIITGTGRNVGKTLTACRIIEHLATKYSPVGVKVSSHMHPLPDNMKILSHNENFVVAEEKSFNNKDSSRMLQAGAGKAYYIQAHNGSVHQAFLCLLPKLDPSQPVVVESGGLYDFIEPSVLLRITGHNPKITGSIRPGTVFAEVPSNKALTDNHSPVSFINQKFVLNV